MARFDDEFIQRMKDDYDIVALIESYGTKLKPRGEASGEMIGPQEERLELPGRVRLRRRCDSVGHARRESQLSSCGRTVEQQRRRQSGGRRNESGQRAAVGIADRGDGRRSRTTRADHRLLSRAVEAIA